jgi:hypothetical protein
MANRPTASSQIRRQTASEIRESFSSARAGGKAKGLPPWAPKGYNPNHIPEIEIDIGKSDKGYFIVPGGIIYFSLNPEKVKEDWEKNEKEATDSTPASTEIKRKISFQLLSDNVFTLSPNPMGPGKQNPDGSWADPRVPGMIERLRNRRDARADTIGLSGLLPLSSFVFGYGGISVNVKMLSLSGEYTVFDNKLQCLRSYIDITLECV